jgi:hypothetical protein
MQEAYPDEPAVTELTHFDILWQNMIQAKKNGDEVTHNAIAQQLKKEYPERFVSGQAASNIQFATQEEIDQYNLHRGAETLVYNGNILTYGTSTEAGGNPRTVRLRSAPDGSQYLGFATSSVDADTLMLFRSSDGGITWLLNAKVTFAGGQQLNGGDFFITDTTGGYRIGLIFSMSAPTVPIDPLLTFVLFSPGNATPTLINSLSTPDPGRGFINPVIVSDGYYYSPSTTYWYIAYQDYSSSTPTNNPVRAALTTDWGNTWTFTTVRSGFNDYDVAIEFNSYPTGDSVFVLLTNNLSASNPNLRIRKVALSNFTGAFSQYNPASTSDPEFHGTLEVNRTTGEMICAFTRRTGGINNVAYVYSRPGAQYFTPTNPTYIAQHSYNEEGVDVSCFEGGTLYRLSYLADGPSQDSVLFKWSFDLSTGFEGPIVINENNNSSNQIFPSVTGFYTLIDGSPDDNSGIVFSGENQSGLYYNFIPDIVLPVELISFGARVEGQNIHLYWQTVTEVNNRGFEIEKRVMSNEYGVVSWENVGYVAGYGTTSEIKSYSFTDNKVSTGTYNYRLKQIDFDGTFEYSDEVEVNVFVPGKFSLSQNYPNPFNPSTIINYSIPSNSYVKLELFSVTGEKLSSFVNSIQEAGYYSIELKSDELGLSSGTYFYRLIAIDNSSGKEYVETKKLLLMK